MMKTLFVVPEALKLPREDFNAIVEAQIDHIRNTLARKGQEYSPGGDDALHNFNIAAAIDQVHSGRPKSREQVIWDMAKKHHVSILDMIYILADFTPDKITQELLDEKFGDMINYLILLKASFMQSKPKTPLPL